MKTTLSVLALVMALAPSLTQAGVIMSDPLIDSISEAEITPSDQVNDALENAVNGAPIYSEPINDLILDVLEDGHRRGVSIRTGAMLKCVVRGVHLPADRHFSPLVRQRTVFRGVGA